MNPVAADMRSRLSDQQGIGVVETLVATVLLAVGLLGAIAGLTSARNATHVAQRTEIAVHIAQQQIEKMRLLPYDQLSLRDNPSSANNTGAGAGSPNARLADLTAAGHPGLYWFKFDPGSGGLEWVATPAARASFMPEETGIPLVYSEGNDASIPSGYKVYRYVTYRNQGCGDPSVCTTFNSKRLTVAVTADPVAANPSRGPTKPVWSSTIVAEVSR